MVGAGLMASQLATLFLRRLRVPLVITDLDRERVDRGLAAIHAEVDLQLTKKRVSPDEANRMRALVSGTTDLADFADCDFVIEAVFEELSIKQQVFADLEKHVAPSCLLATNTSSLSVTEMAVDLEHPGAGGRLPLLLNPVAVLPLLESCRGDRPTNAVLATPPGRGQGAAEERGAWSRTLRGSCSKPALAAEMGEVFTAVDEGTPIPVADAALKPLGLPMPPFVLLQLVGPPIVLHVGESLHAAFGDRFPISENLRAIVAAQRTGFYDWSPDGETCVPARSRLAAADAGRARGEVRERALLPGRSGRMLRGRGGGPDGHHLC